MISSLDTLVAKRRTEPYRVLIVDDDIYLSSHYSKILESAQVNAHIINNPLNVLEALIEHKPDILLLDMHMPECNGVELAEALKQHDAYSHIPIIFLSGEKDISKHFLARAAGADDYLQKPIEDRHLISTVINRAQRARSSAAKMYYDGMTGVLTHEKIQDELQRQLILSSRNKSKVAFCMCDLDDFKAVNDRYGHLTGDLVIKRLASLLKQRLRRSDIIGRYGGDEFAIILPDTNIDDAYSLLDRLRDDFYAMEHTTATDHFNVSISVGITAVNENDTDIMSIIDRADKALYQNKSKRSYLNVRTDYPFNILIIDNLHTTCISSNVSVF